MVLEPNVTARRPAQILPTRQEYIGVDRGNPTIIRRSKEAEEMRFLLGVLVGYSMRGKKKLLITVLATIVFFVYIILPAIMLMALSLDVKRSASRDRLKPACRCSKEVLVTV